MNAPEDATKVVRDRPGGFMQTWCVDCLVLSPKTDGLYELGAEGWRAVGGVGEAQFEWRCPDCWPAFKEVMGDATVSSARFRAAAAIELARFDDHPKDAESGERLLLAEDTPRETRHGIVAGVVREILEILSAVPVRTSFRASHLLARTRHYESVVTRWSESPPAPEEQVAVFEKITRLHADVCTLAAAYRRVQR